MRPPAPMNGVRARLEKMEEKFLEDREIATAIDISTAGRLSTRPTAISEGDDVDAEGDAFGDLEDGIAGYRRINRGDMCELR
jgi:hypothetical protein